MKLHCTAMSGPEFLDAVADAETANGNQINADVYRQRAMEWNQDLQSLHKMQGDLQDAHDRLADIRRTAQTIS